MTVLITGASRGIGAETAKEFYGAGYNVVINYFKSKGCAEELKKTLELNKAPDNNSRIELYACDVSDAEQVRGMIDFTIKRFGGIDVLVNNAGIAACGLFTEQNEAEDRRIFDINVFGMLSVSRAVLPHMLGKKSGCIINISSIHGVAGASCEVVYSASKAAVIGFTKALSREAGLSGIRVNCIAPGVIDTRMNENLNENDLKVLREKTSLNRIGGANEIAKAVLFLAGGSSGYITGQCIIVDGGIL